MEISSGLIIAVIIGLIAGIVIISLINKNKSLSLLSDAKKEAEKIIESAKDKGESIKNNKILQAKEKFLELKGFPDTEVMGQEDIFLHQNILKTGKNAGCQCKFSIKTEEGYCKMHFKKVYPE